MKGGVRLDTEDVEDLQKQDHGDTDFHQHEKEIEQQVEDTAKRLSASIGYRTVPWREVCYVALLFQLILGILS